MNAIGSYLRANGTKLMGDILTVIGVLSLMDRMLLVELFGDRIYMLIILISGVAFRIRGHVNTAHIKDEIRVEEKAKEQIKIENAALQIRSQNETTRIL